MEEKKICYWKTGVNLLLSLIATAFVILVGIKAIFFFMPFVIGWMIALIASPLVKWLEKRLKIVRKLGTAIIIVAVLALIVLGIYFVLSRLWILFMGFVDTLPDYVGYFSDSDSGLLFLEDSICHIIGIMYCSIGFLPNTRNRNSYDTMGDS